MSTIWKLRNSEIDIFAKSEPETSCLTEIMDFLALKAPLNANLYLNQGQTYLISYNVVNKSRSWISENKKIQYSKVAFQTLPEKNPNVTKKTVI